MRIALCAIFGEPGYVIREEACFTEIIVYIVLAVGCLVFAASSFMNTKFVDNSKYDFLKNISQEEEKEMNENTEEDASDKEDLKMLIKYGKNIFRSAGMLIILVGIFFYLYFRGI